MRRVKIKKIRAFAAALITVALYSPCQNVLAGAKDDPLLSKVKIDQLEQRNGDEDPFVVEAQAWVGYDLDKIWLKTEAERVEGDNESVELQLLYSKAITAYWNLQLGARQDYEPTPKRNWAVVGFQGVAPYYIEIDTALFIGESGRASVRFKAEHELMLTQRLVLIPEIKLDFFGKTDEETETGSGLSKAEVGLRLAYEIKREFAPYIGVNWERKYGATARYSKDEGGSTNDTQFVIGLKAWF